MVVILWIPRVTETPSQTRLKCELYCLSVFLFPVEACNGILSSMPHRCLYPTFPKTTYPEGPGKRGKKSTGFMLFIKTVLYLEFFKLSKDFNAKISLLSGSHGLQVDIFQTMV